MAIIDIYCRISSDREGGGLGVARQEKDCRTHLVNLGHSVGDVLVDNDSSAYKGSPRPQYRTLIERLKSGASAGFVVWHLDRLTRHPKELEDVIDVVEATGAIVLTVTGGAYDLSQTDGRAMARVVGAFARKESEDKARRTKRKHLELAQAGRPVGGTRHFGYDPLRVDGEPVLLDATGYPTLRIRPDEAAQIVEAMRSILAGESLRSITRRWNDEGITATRGGRMTSGAVRRILTSPTLAGWRTLDRVPVVRGTWEPIVDDALLTKVTAVIESRGNPRKNPRTYLLSGMIRCSLCGCGLVTQARKQASGRRRSYVCSPDPSKDSCGRVRIVAEETETEVLDRILASIDESRLAADDGPDPTTPLLAEVERTEADQAQLARDYYADHRISRREFFAASEALEARLQAARHALAQTARKAVLRPVVASADALRAEWDQADIGRRRAIVEQFVDHVIITPANHSRGKFDPTRIVVVWVA